MKRTQGEAGVNAQLIASIAVLPVTATVAQVERFAIEGALKQTGHDCTLAAILVGIGRTTLYRKLKQYEKDDAAAAATVGSHAEPDVAESSGEHEVGEVWQV